MQIVLLALALIAAFTPPAQAQGAATRIAKDAARGAKTARLSVDALCAQLTLDEVTAIMGNTFERRPDGEQLFKECTYGDSKDRQGHSLYLRANAKITEDQAVALAKAAMN